MSRENPCLEKIHDGYTLVATWNRTFYLLLLLHHRCNGSSSGGQKQGFWFSKCRQNGKLQCNFLQYAATHLLSRIRVPFSLYSCTYITIWCKMTTHIRIKAYLVVNGHSVATKYFEFEALFALAPIQNCMFSKWYFVTASSRSDERTVTWISMSEFIHSSRTENKVCSRWP